MKNFYFLLVPFISFSQVGINTTSPQATLHVGGPTSEVKIEGLSETYNPNNLGSTTTTRVFANTNGDLVLGTASDNLNFIMDSEDYIPNNREQKVTQTGTGGNFTLFEINDYVFPSFILEKDGVIEVSYSMSWYSRRNNTQKVSDGGARSVETTIFIRHHYDPANPTVYNYLPGNYALVGQFYANGNDVKGADGRFYSTASDYISLPAGRYTIIFAGRFTAGGNSNIFSFFGGAQDQLQIIAYYNN